MSGSSTASPVVHHVACRSHGETATLAVADWPGAADLPPLVCIPGFTRTRRDFDDLARSLDGRRRLLCLDLVGRGASTRLADPAGYTMANYVAQVKQVLGSLALAEVSVLGVSMGGLLAMALASDPSVGVRDLVVVDVGPTVPRIAFDLLDLYLATERSFPDFDALLVHVRRYFAACNLPSELAWRWFALRGARRLPDGRYQLDYDPAIRVAFRDDFRGMQQAWERYDCIDARTLVLRGAQSHVLPADVAEEMTRRGPHASVITISGTGHWPALVRPEENAAIGRFLAS
ncbi:MAG: alpha/beta fold hydrolase [Pseudomonadota bacterium]